MKRLRLKVKKALTQAGCPDIRPGQLKFLNQAQRLRDIQEERRATLIRF